MNQNSTGYALAMRVLQSDLYAQLDDQERAECDALLEKRLPEWLCHKKVKAAKITAICAPDIFYLEGVPLPISPKDPDFFPCMSPKLEAILCATPMTMRATALPKRLKKATRVSNENRGA